MIIRTEKTKNYTTISNFHLEDNRLSLKAKGLLTYFLSRPDYWKIYIEQVEKTTKDGRTTIKTAIEELIQTGYMAKTKQRENGRQSNTDYTVYEQPKVTNLSEADFLNQNFCFRNTESENLQLINTELKQELKLLKTELSPVANNMPETTKPQKKVDYKLPSSFSSVGSVLSSISNDFNSVNSVNPVSSSVSPVLNNSVGSVSSSVSPVFKNSVGSVSSAVNPVCNSDNDLIMQLVRLLPVKYQHDSILIILQQALQKHSVDYIKRSIDYTTARVKGDPPQYTSYLKKCLNGGWAGTEQTVKSQNNISPIFSKINQMSNQTENQSKLENLRRSA